MNLGLSQKQAEGKGSHFRPGSNPNQMRINRMIQADRVLSTPPTDTSAIQTQPSRRTFLAEAAGVSAGGAVLGMTIPLPAPAAESQADPIFAAIEKHKALIGPYAAAMRARARFDDCGEDDDSPSAELMRLNDAIDSTHLPLEIAASELICVVPNTPAGVIAAIRVIQRYHRNDRRPAHA
jgi:hypothetical protein